MKCVSTAVFAQMKKPEARVVNLLVTSAPGQSSASAKEPGWRSDLAEAVGEGVDILGCFGSYCCSRRKVDWDRSCTRKCPVNIYAIRRRTCLVERSSRLPDLTCRILRLQRQSQRDPRQLDYLKDVGVKVLWLSPVYRSPLADMGYDMYVVMLCSCSNEMTDATAVYSSDYRDIDPRYGTLDEWDNLLKGVHKHGMKLV